MMSWYVEQTPAGWELIEHRPGESNGHLAMFPDTEEKACRLAAAAPNLLDACEMLYARLCREQDGKPRSRWRSAVAMLRIAIAKAKGD
jgi:hypothetical protein